jgi:hypothetical protein
VTRKADKKTDKKEVDEEQLKLRQKFNKDVDMLHYDGGHTYAKIAGKMGKKNSNLGNYRNGKHFITQEIRINLENAWGGELKTLYEKRGETYIPEFYPISIVEEKDQVYAIKNYTETLIATLQKTNNVLLKSTQKLVKTNEKLAETNKKLVDAHISFLGQQRKNPDSGRSGEKFNTDEEPGE